MGTIRHTKAEILGALQTGTPAEELIERARRAVQAAIRNDGVEFDDARSRHMHMTRARLLVKAAVAIRAGSLTRQIVMEVWDSTLVRLDANEMKLWIEVCPRVELTPAW